MRRLTHYAARASKVSQEINYDDGTRAGVASPCPDPCWYPRGCGNRQQPDHNGLGKEAGHEGAGHGLQRGQRAVVRLFVATCLAEDGVAAAPIAVRAKAWATWGANLAVAKLAPGAVLVFERAGGGHVGFYVGEDLSSYHVLGGNQGDRVSIMRLEKSRCIARR